MEEKDLLDIFSNTKYKKYFVYKKYFTSDFHVKEEIFIFEKEEDLLNHLKNLDDKYNKVGRKYYYYKKEKIPGVDFEEKYIAIFADSFWEKLTILANHKNLKSFLSCHFNDINQVYKNVFLDSSYRDSLLYLLVPQKSIVYCRKKKIRNKSEIIEREEILEKFLYGELLRLEPSELF